MVCGYRLFDALDFVNRGVSALLNARLVPLIDAFLKAVDIALKDKEIDVEPVIVRSDGTLMSKRFAKLCPVETLLCGPVASAMGASELAKVDKDAVIVDMGGTTTDIAFIKDKNPVRVKGGIKIGNWKTLVKGLYVETFGLGGDSAVHYRDWKPYLEDERVIPLCILADEYPFIVNELKVLAQGDGSHTRWIHEYYVLQKEITNKEGYSEAELEICEALKDGPLSLMKLAKKLHSPVYSLNLTSLEKKGIIMRAGMTPTDVMHIKGDYTQYCTEASVYAATFVARCSCMSLEEFCDWVYEEVKHKMYTHLAEIFLRRDFKELKDEPIGTLQYFIEKNWKQARGKDSSKNLEVSFKVPEVFIGIGGPTKIFLPDVAKAFGSYAVIPEYAAVANAVGAVMSSVAFEVIIKVHACYTLDGMDCYEVYRKGESKRYSLSQFDEACDYASRMIEIDAREEARMRGIGGEIQINIDKYKEYYYDDVVENIVYAASVTQL
ncbi:N-methylhydantoinase (ATP-hydrolyzing) [Lachnospiraceae bacterium TWA4]|nr:N-methylhydantoinase (ATP-hydrolyzing) [Lachnospiraceae bacterium TWA4]